MSTTPPTTPSPETDYSDEKYKIVSSKGRSFNPDKYLDVFQELVEAGKSEEEIAKIMGLTPYTPLNQNKFYKLKDTLSRRTKKFYDIPSKSNERDLKVKSTGITISPEKIKSLGLDTLFPHNKKVSVERNGDTIVIKAVE